MPTPLGFDSMTLFSVVNVNVPPSGIASRELNREIEQHLLDLSGVGPETDHRSFFRLYPDVDRRLETAA